MKACPLYNGQNLVYTGYNNPYGLILKGGLARKKRTNKKRILSKKSKKIRRRINTHTKKRYNR